MCNPMAAYAAAAIIGAGVAYKGQQNQKAEYNRARREQEAHTAAQRQMALNQKQEERKFSDEKNQSILDEAATVAPQSRAQQVTAAEDKQTDSNVKALQAANLLGEDAISTGAAGNQSDEYIAARANAAANQTERAVKLARLFGQQGAGQAAMADQALGALDFRLNQQAIDAKRRSMQRGYGWMFDDLAQRQQLATKVDPSKGANAQLIGGTMMNIGLSGLGGEAGTYFGKQAGSAQSQKLF